MIPNVPAIQDPIKYSEFDLPRAKVEGALNEAYKKIDKLIEQVGYRFPREYSTNNVYKTVDNVAGWGNGFWSGILWHAYELTGNEKYKETVLGQIPSFTKRISEKIGVNHHDMGFLFSLSCVAAYKLTDNEEAKAAALAAKAAAENAGTTTESLKALVENAEAKAVAAENAAKAAKETTVGELTLDHVNKFAEELKEAGIVTDKVSPILLPRYTHGNPKFEAK